MCPHAPSKHSFSTRSIESCEESLTWNLDVLRGSCFSTRSIESCEESQSKAKQQTESWGFSTRSIESCEESVRSARQTPIVVRFQYSLYRVV